MILVWKKFPPSRVIEVAANEVPIDKNIDKTKIVIPGKIPAPTCPTPIFEAIWLEKKTIKGVVIIMVRYWKE